jgi:hypothetical protein
MLKKVLKHIVRIIHVIMILFLFGGAFIPKKYLILFIFAWPLLYLHWQTNNNKCICTQVECWFDNQPYCLDQNEDFPFMTQILKIINIEIKDNKTKQYIFCTTLTFFWLIGMYRYYN